MTIPEQITNKVKDTVGYMEASNKVSFMTGSQVAFNIAEEYFATWAKQLQQERDNYKREMEEAQGDLKMLARIIGDYQNKD